MGRNLAFTEPSLWFKGEYEIKVVNGIKFISPVPGNEAEDYDPFEYDATYQLKSSKDHIKEASPHTALARINLDDHDEILEFVNTWGLLGLWKIPSFSYGDFQLRDYKFHTDEIFEEPYRKRGRASKREPLHLFIKAASEYQRYAKMHTDFHKRKGELSINDIKRSDLLDELQSLTEINEDKKEAIARKFRITKQELVEMIELNNVALELTLLINKKLKGNTSPQEYFSVKQNEKITGWYFNSLLGALYLKAFNSKPFKHCEWENCKKLFISENPIAEYCSVYCGDSARKVILRNNQSKKELKKIFNEQDPDWIEKQVNHLLSIGISGPKRLEKSIRRIIEKGE